MYISSRQADKAPGHRHPCRSRNVATASSQPYQQQSYWAPSCLPPCPRQPRARGVRGTPCVPSSPQPGSKAPASRSPRPIFFKKN
jgi:hypothetical protein